MQGMGEREVFQGEGFEAARHGLISGGEIV